MESINGGYLALAFVGIVFFGLQFWWIGMTIRNGKNEQVRLDQDHMGEAKNRLERIYAKSSRDDVDKSS